MPTHHLHEPTQLATEDGAGAWLFEDGSPITWEWSVVSGAERITAIGQAPSLTAAAHVPSITASARVPSVTATGRPI